MVHCAALNCSNNSKKGGSTKARGIHFHRFPSHDEEERRKAWITRCNRFEWWTPGRYAAICNEHFRPEDYETNLKICAELNKRPTLKKTAVPSKFKLRPTDACQQKLKAKGNGNQSFPGSDIRISQVPEANTELNAGNFTSVIPDSEHSNVANVKLEIGLGGDEDVICSESEPPLTKRARMVAGETQPTSGSEDLEITEENETAQPNQSAASFENLTLTQRKVFEDIVANHRNVFRKVATSVKEKEKKMRTWNSIAKTLATKSCFSKARTFIWTAEELMTMWSRKMFADVISSKTIRIPPKLSEDLTPEENAVFEEQIDKYEEIVDVGPPRKQAASVNEVWQAITDKVNEVNKGTRTVEDMQEKLYLKKRSRKDPPVAKNVKISTKPSEHLTVQEETVFKEQLEKYKEITGAGASQKQAACQVWRAITDKVNKVNKGTPRTVEELQEKSNLYRTSLVRKNPDAEVVKKSKKRKRVEVDVPVKIEVENAESGESEIIGIIGKATNGNTELELVEIDEVDTEIVSQDKGDACLGIVLPWDCEKLELDDRSVIIIQNEFPTSGDDFVRIKEEPGEDTHLSSIQTETVHRYIADHVKKVTGNQYVLEMDACDWTFLYDKVHKVDPSCEHKLPSLKVRVSKIIKDLNNRIQGSCGS